MAVIKNDTSHFIKQRLWYYLMGIFNWIVDFYVIDLISKFMNVMYEKLQDYVSVKDQ